MQGHGHVRPKRKSRSRHMVTGLAATGGHCSGVVCHHWLASSLLSFPVVSGRAVSLFLREYHPIHEAFDPPSPYSADARQHAVERTKQAKKCISSCGRHCAAAFAEFRWRLPNL